MVTNKFHNAHPFSQDLKLKFAIENYAHWALFFTSTFQIKSSLFKARLQKIPCTNFPFFQFLQAQLLAKKFWEVSCGQDIHNVTGFLYKQRIVQTWLDRQFFSGSDSSRLEYPFVWFAIDFYNNIITYGVNKAVVFCWLV
jgi:hypothetical protein